MADLEAFMILCTMLATSQMGRGFLESKKVNGLEEEKLTER